MWRIIIILSLILTGMGSLAAQSGTEDQILTEINRNRATPLTRDPNLDQLATALIQNFANDCTYFGGGDTAQATTLGWQGDFEVVRDCGIDKTVSDAITIFTQLRSNLTEQLLISETRWNVVGLAAGEVPINNRTQYRYVMVLGTIANVVAPAPTVDLSTPFIADSLGVIFPQPAGWIADTTRPDAITLVADPADLPAATDGDATTLTAQPFMNLTRLDRAQLALSPDAGLAEATKFVNNVIQFTPVQSEAHQVMAYPAATMIGSDANNSHGIITFWMQRDALMIMSLTTPTLGEAQAWLPIWEQILNQIHPATALELPQSIVSQFMKTEINYPANWVIFDANDRLGLFELSSDRDLYVAGQFAYFSGVVVTALFQPLQQITDSNILPANPTLEQLLDLNTRFVGLSNVQSAPGSVFGEPAIFVEAIDSSGFQIFGVMGLVDGNVYFIQAASPNLAALDKFKPTFRWMVHQFKRVQ